MPGFCERRAMTRWRIAIASSYAATAAGRSGLREEQSLLEGADSSLVTESSLTARRAHFNASFSISLDETRGGPGGDGSLGCFRLRRVYGGGCREYGGGGIGLDMDGGWDGGVREGGRERVVMVGWL